MASFPPKILLFKQRHFPLHPYFFSFFFCWPVTLLAPHGGPLGLDAHNNAQQVKWNLHKHRYIYIYSTIFNNIITHRTIIIILGCFFLYWNRLYSNNNVNVECRVLMWCAVCTTCELNCDGSIMKKGKTFRIETYFQNEPIEFEYSRQYFVAILW